MSQKIEHVNVQVKIIIVFLKETLDWKSTIIEMEEWHKGPCSYTADMKVEELLNLLRDQEIMQSIDERMKKNKQSLREVWDPIKYTDIHTMGKKRQNGKEKNILRNVENFPNLLKNNNTYTFRELN